METKMIRVAFEVELARRIQNKECEGRIVTNSGKEVRIVCFDMLNEKAPIIALRKDDNFNETALSFNVNGCCAQGTDYTLFLEIPEYMTFKNGDVIAFGRKRVYIGIYKCANKSNGAYSDYVVLNDIGDLIFDKDCWIHNDARFATEEETQKLIDALKADERNEAKECLKKLGVEVKQEYEFKPFDRVLVRDGNKEKWKADLFSYKTENDVFSYMCVSDSYKECIPYNEQTAHLLGTTEKYE